MRILWDEKKSLENKHHPKRRTSFNEVTRIFLDENASVGGALKSDDPEQYYIIGIASNGKLITVVYEYQTDDIGDYIRIITLWKTTPVEKRSHNL